MWPPLPCVAVTGSKRMACFRPLKGFRILPDGGFFTSEHSCRGHDYAPMNVACGQCIGCRLDRSLHWGVRCVHESKMHKRNCFVTLTYDDEHLPLTRDGLPTLVKKDLQDFNKRLRFHRGSFRFYACGEYGTRTRRPHYHVCLFGMDFEDKKLISDAKGYPEFDSKILRKIWTAGNSRIGELNRETACYTARYICDKITGDLADSHYLGREPEFNTMSNKPGIGATWLYKFWSDVYPSGKVVSNGMPRNPPKYYDKLLDRREVHLGGEVGKWLRIDREEEALLRADDNTERRLADREEVATLNLKRIARGGV